MREVWFDLGRDELMIREDVGNGVFPDEEDPWNNYCWPELCFLM